MNNLLLKAAMYGARALEKKLNEKKEASLIDKLNIATEFYNKNDYSSAIYYYQQSIPYLEDKIDNINQFRYSMASCYYMLNQYQKAIESLRDIIYKVKFNSEDNEFRSIVYIFISINFYKLGDMNQAVRNMKQALNIDKKNTLKLGNSNSEIDAILNSNEFHTSKKSDIIRRIIIIGICIVIIFGILLNSNIYSDFKAWLLTHLQGV